MAHTHTLDYELEFWSSPLKMASLPTPLQQKPVVAIFHMVKPPSADLMEETKKQRLIAEAKSLKHLMSHYPQNPYCDVCNSC